MQATPPLRAEEDGRAFDLPGGPDAVLLLHGFTGSPFEVRYVADRLNREGLRCVGPWMAGHEGGPTVLALTGWRDWVETARARLLDLAGARRVHVVGCSMGALVACVLAHEHPDRVARLALLAPALRLARPGRIVGLLARTPLPRLLPLIPKGGSDVRDAEMRRRNPAMQAIPVAPVAELVELERRVDRILPAISAPAIVLHGAEDHTVTLDGARRLARRIGSGPARLVVLPRSYHLVGIDVDRERCADEVAAFLGEDRR